MGSVISKIISYAREIINGVTVSRVKTDIGGGNYRTATEFHPVGEDSAPLPNDYGIMVKVPGTDKYVVVGYIDHDNTPESSPGEKKIYSRNESTGSVSAFIRLKNDGSVLVSNGLENGTITINVDGSITAKSPFIRLGDGSLVPVVDGVVTPKCVCTFMGYHLQGSSTVMATS